MCKLQSGHKEKIFMHGDTSSCENAKSGRELVQVRRGEAGVCVRVWLKLKTVFFLFTDALSIQYVFICFTSNNRVKNSNYCFLLFFIKIEGFLPPQRRDCCNTGQWCDVSMMGRGGVAG